MRVLVTGSRKWPDLLLVDEVIRQIAREHPGQEMTLVSGGAKGADRMAEQAARDLNWRIETHIPDWRPGGVYDIAAGHKRNQYMVDSGADLCVAFILNNSKGATHCMKTAERAGIPVHLYALEGAYR